MRKIFNAILGKFKWFKKDSSGVVVIIPARISSTRLPGKVLLPINGKPLVWHVYSACKKAGIGKGKVMVAVDHKSITKALSKHGVPTILTSPFHNSGTDRLLEACDKLRLSDDTVVLNVQGDEPEIDPMLIKQLAIATKYSNADIVTLKTEVSDISDLNNVNVVKVVTGIKDHVLLFTRASAPYVRNTVEDFKYYRHVGMYGYTVKTLRKFSKLPPSVLEQTEGLEQLRALENGMTIKAMTALIEPKHGVDTQADYEATVKRMRLDQ